MGSTHQGHSRFGGSFFGSKMGSQSCVGNVFMFMESPMTTVMPGGGVLHLFWRASWDRHILLVGLHGPHASRFVVVFELTTCRLVGLHVWTNTPRPVLVRTATQHDVT